MQILLAFYSEFEPSYATPPKVEKVLRTYQRKGEKARKVATKAAEEDGSTAEIVEWRELMYSAITKQRGTDPREFWGKLSPRCDAYQLDLCLSFVHRRPCSDILLQQTCG